MNPDVTRQALQQTLVILAQARWTDWRWIAVLLVIFGVSYVIADDRLFLIEGTIGIVVAIMAVVLFFASIWCATRLFGDPERQHQGSLGAWLGWALLAIALTASIMLFAEGFMWFGAGEAMDIGFWASSLFYLVLFSLTAPLVLRSASAAINKQIDWASLVYPFWSKHLAQMFLGYLLVQAPAWLMGEAIDGVIQFASLDDAAKLFLLLASASLSTALSIVGSAYLVACVQLGLAHSADAQLPREAELS